MSTISGPSPDPLRRVAGFRTLPIAAPRVRRVTQLVLGLVLFGVGGAFGIEAALGVSPWTVFHQGVALRIGVSIGTVVVVVGLILALLFRPLAEPIGLGTLLNALIIGPAIDVTMWLIPDITNLPVRILLLVAGPAVIGLGSGFYIGAGLGPGPRDGLMTALTRRGLTVWTARTGIELTALFVGWLLGGNVGLGTVWAALSVGWFVGFFLPRLSIDEAAS